MARVKRNSSRIYTPVFELAGRSVLRLHAIESSISLAMTGSTHSGTIAMLPRLSAEQEQT